MITFKQYILEQLSSGNYASIDVKEKIDVPLLIKDLSGVEVPLEKQHVTLMYSEFSNIPHEKILHVLEDLFPETIFAEGYEFECFDSPDDPTKSALVLKVESFILNQMHTHLLSMGCNHSYPEYQPHISFFYGVDKEECHAIKDLLNQVTKFPIRVSLSGIKTEDIKKDWGKNLS